MPKCLYFLTCHCPARIALGCSLAMLLCEGLSYLWFQFAPVPRSVLALSDIPFNITVAVVAILPFVLVTSCSISKALMWAALVSVGIDLDHFVMAQSWSVSDAIQLPHRPATHSFVMVGLLAAGLALIMKSWQVGVLTFLPLTAHLLRDASGGNNLLLYPVSTEFFKISPSGCTILLVILPVVAFVLGKYGANKGREA